MEIKLLNLYLSNFKGIEEFSLTLDGRSATVYGQNGTGKTTILDAYLWLLFGKDSEGNTNFEIKTIDPKTKKPVKKGLHSVEACLEISGRELKLKKYYLENWTKKRGSNKESFTSHTTKYFIDDLEAKKKDYEIYLRELIDPELFYILSDVTYFNEKLSWQKRRKQLLDIVDRMSEHRFAEGVAKFTQLKDIFQKRTAGQHEGQLKKEMREINSKIKEIPARIEELHSHHAHCPKKEELKARVDILEKLEKKYGVEYEKLQSELFLLEQFQREYYSALEKDINEKFELVDFKLREETIEGDVKDTCIATIDGVAYPNLNHGKRVNAGLDIIKTFGDLYDTEAPVFIDNAESVVNIKEVDTQVVKLYVSEEDNCLRVKHG